MSKKTVRPEEGRPSAEPADCLDGDETDARPERSDGYDYDGYDGYGCSCDTTGLPPAGGYGWGCGFVGW